MNNLDILAMAFRNFRRRKARSALTISGVVIGVTAIVVMVSIGMGLNESIEQQMAQWGSLTTVQVYGGGGGGYSYYGNGMAVSASSGGDSQGAQINDEAVLNFEEIPNVVAATPYKYSSAKLVSGRYVGYVSLIGIDASKMELFGYEVEKGRVLNGEDTAAVVMGSEVVYNFYDSKKRNPYAYDPNEPVDEYGRPYPKVTPMEDLMKLTMDTSYGEKQNLADGTEDVVAKKPKLYNIEVVGVFKESGENDYNTFIDINYLKKITKEYLKTQENVTQSQLKQVDAYDQILVKVDSVDHVMDVLNTIKADGYQVYSLVESVKQMQQQMMVAQLILGGIGGISLLVAAIGIANTMIMSIYERTREIGIMKVLGCRLKDIRRLFLYEAGLIGLVGGAAGLVLSLLLSLGLNQFGGSILGSMTGNNTGTLSVIPAWLMLAAVAFAILVGLLSGFYPARRAMRLSALDAIRAE